VYSESGKDAELQSGKDAELQSNKKTPKQRAFMLAYNVIKPPSIFLKQKHITLP